MSHSRAKKKRRGWLSCLPALLIAVLTLYDFFYGLDHYRSHAGGGDTFTPILLLVVSAVFLIVFLARRNLRGALSILLPAAVCLFCLRCARKIPNCPLCDGTTAEGLGFLIHWIPLGP